MKSNTTTWRTVRLSDVIDLHSGGTPSRSQQDYWGGNIKWLSIPDIASADGGYIYDSSEKITEAGLQHSPARVVPKDTIVISARGTVGKLAMLNEPMAFNQSCYGITTKDKALLEQKYLFYALKNAVRSAKHLAHGGVFDTFTTSTFEHINISAPSSVDEQKRIAEVFSAFDEKIENNNRIIKTLEEMAQAIFKEWFVKFRFPGHEKTGFVDSPQGQIPKGWKVKCIGDFFKVKSGLPYKAEFVTNSKADFPILTMGSIIVDQRFTKEEVKRYRGEYRNNHLLNRGDIIIASHDVTQDRKFLGSPAIITPLFEKVIMGNNLYGLENISTASNAYFFQVLKSADYRAHILASAKGSNIVFVSKSTIENYHFAFPSEEILAKYAETANLVSKEIEAKYLETQKLTAMRDLLLPRLMSGEIRV